MVKERLDRTQLPIDSVRASGSLALAFRQRNEPTVEVDEALPPDVRRGLYPALARPLAQQRQCSRVGLQRSWAETLTRGIEVGGN